MQIEACKRQIAIPLSSHINAGKNILAAGLAVLVCGATVRPDESKSPKAGAMKQKPKS